jgi:hemerythrin-like domain-containing protein
MKDAFSARRRLSDDHQAVSEVLEQLVTALDNRDVGTSYSKLDLLWARLAVHIRAEHLHLFPAVSRRLPEVQTTVENLRTDHDFFMRELARAAGILRELRNGDESALRAVTGTIRDVESRLATHNKIEEDQIYAQASIILTETEQLELLAQINAELENRPPRFSEEAWANP